MAWAPRATATSRFIDGDCIPRPDFIARHRALAEPGWMVAGNRILLSEDFTRRTLAERWPLHAWRRDQWELARREGAINRTLPLAHLHLGPLRKLQALRWQRVRTCNLGLWRRDFAAVNGFDEAYEGWGFEDSDLAVRLLNAGIRRKEGAFATGLLHLWHPENDRRFEARNLERLRARMASKDARYGYSKAALCTRGWTSRSASSASSGRTRHSSGSAICAHACALR